MIMIDGSRYARNYAIMQLQSTLEQLRIVRDNAVKVIVLVFSNISQERRKDAIVAIFSKAFFNTRRPFLRELIVFASNPLRTVLNVLPGFAPM